MRLLKTIWALFGVLLKLPFLPLWPAIRRLTRPKGSWVHVRLRPMIEEVLDPRAAWLARWIPMLRRRSPTSIASLLALGDALAGDPRIEGVLLEIPMLQAGWTKIDALRAWVAGLRKAGKRVTAYLPQGGSHKEIFLACAADRVFLAPAAPLVLLGLSASTYYLKGALEKAGIRYERFASGAFKTANERLAQDTMSDAQREQVGALLDTWQQALSAALEEGRGFDAERVAALYETVFFQNGQATDAGLVDEIVFEDELPTRLGLGKRRPIAAAHYLAWALAQPLSPLRAPPYVAVVPIKGPILEESARGGRARIVADLRAAGADRRARAVIVLIDSPGGSPLVSDQIHREILRIRESKPVVALLSDVAASGGYYVAAAADAIVASPLTVTGSIGVVGGLPKIDQLLERLGVRTEILRTTTNADLFSVGQPMPKEGRALFERSLEAYYHRFLEIVADGRNKTTEEVDAVAKGRVWTGQAALERGLVDRLGGLETALEEVRERTKLPPAAAQKLKARTIHATHLDLPPPAPATTWASRLLGIEPLMDARHLIDELGLLQILALSSHHTPLYYAENVPTIS